MAFHTSLPVSLLDLLSNTLILYQTCPYLPVSSLLNLAATARCFKSLVFDTPNVFRYLDLSTTKYRVSLAPIDAGGELWRNERMDEALTEDEFVTGPLRGIFSFLKGKGVLRDVQTLVLDGLSVTADIVHEIICDNSYNVRILSIRGVKNLNRSKLMQVLKYAVRRGRPSGTPKLKGLYYFGNLEVPLQSIPSPASGVTNSSVCGVTTSVGAQLGMQWNRRSQQALSTVPRPSPDSWYEASEILISALGTMNASAVEWAETLRLCQDIIAFDAVLCRGPIHETTGRPAIATVALGATGCQICHSAPEGLARYGGGTTQYDLPLLLPPPFHSSRITDAQRVSSHNVSTTDIPFLARCESCLSNRWCEGCKKFWCEGCYENPETGTYTYMQQLETRERKGFMGIKVHNGLCVEDCLVQEMLVGVGEGGMWG